MPLQLFEGERRLVPVPAQNADQHRRVLRIGVRVAQNARLDAQVLRAQLPGLRVLTLRRERNGQVPDAPQRARVLVAELDAHSREQRAVHPLRLRVPPLRHQAARVVRRDLERHRTRRAEPTLRRADRRDEERVRPRARALARQPDGEQPVAHVRPHVRRAVFAARVARERARRRACFGVAVLGQKRLHEVPLRPKRARLGDPRARHLDEHGPRERLRAQHAPAPHRHATARRQETRALAQAREVDHPVPAAAPATSMRLRRLEADGTRAHFFCPLGSRFWYKKELPALSHGNSAKMKRRREDARIFGALWPPLFYMGEGKK